jgi:bacterioferritin (cytochrome b1)
VAVVETQGLERVLRPIHRWVWADPHRRAQKLLAFAETEADGGRDLARASELTQDGLLRRLYLRHAEDELRHADMFRTRGGALLRSLPAAAGSRVRANWITPGERGLDDLRVESESDESLLAFLHLSEKAAARRFAVYHEVVDHDPETRDVFERILRDEAFHMNYTHTQLRRVSPRRHGARLWLARASRFWKGYVRLSAAIAGLFGGVLLVVQYFVLLPIFALLAKRAAKNEREGWSKSAKAPRSLTTQY